MANWCVSGACLRLIADSRQPITSAQRVADLSGFGAATLAFSYSAYIGTPSGAGYVDISPDGVHYTTLGTLGARYGPIQQSYPIPAEHLTATFHLRFRAVGADPWTDLYIDHLAIHLTPAHTAPPSQEPADEPTGTTLTRTVKSHDGDAEERMADGTVALINSDLDLGTDPDGFGEQWLGLRFEAITIPAGSTIHAARLQFTAHDTDARPTQVHIQGEYSGQASPFSRSPHNLSQRARTSATTVWDIPPWSKKGETHFSEDVSLVIQEIIGHSHWQSGHSLALLISGYGHRSAVSYDRNPAQTPVLHIHYDSATPNQPIEEPTHPQTGSAGCGRAPAFTGHQYQSILSSGKTRRYYLSIPSDYQPDQPHNLVFGFHGINWDGVRMRQYLKLETQPQAVNTIFVYPDALSRHWPEFGQTAIGWLLQPYNNEDFVLFDDIRAHLERTHCINPKGVYVTGQSWGGDMASALSCARGNHIAAGSAVGVNGDFFFTGRWDYPDKYPPLSPADCQGPVAMLTYRGERDWYPGGRSSDWWYQVNQCQLPSGSANKESISQLGRYEDQHCVARNIYTRYSNYGGDDHQIPNHGRFEQETFEFFMTHEKP